MEKCCGEVSVGEECRREVLRRSVVGKCCGEVELEKSVREKCCREVLW